jgi:molybdenum cofactor guanylyltransferase
MSGRCLGVVLAGGAGSRVGGADKGLLPLCGRPLIEHVLDALRPQCEDLLITANRNIAEYSRFAMTIGDEREGHGGPLAGIVAALTYAAPRMDTKHWEWLMTIPVDCPQPPPDLRERLQSALVQSGMASCAVAHDETAPQPLFALYRLSQCTALLASARAALQSHASVLRWQQELVAHAVDFSDRFAAFQNLNTPEEFRGYESAHV